MITIYNVRYRGKRCRQIYMKNGKMYLDAKCQVEADPKYVSSAD